MVSQGVEARISGEVRLADGWRISESILWTMTESTDATPDSPHYGNQLPYIPRHSLAATAKVTWRKWSLVHQWHFTDRRQTNYSGSHLRGSYVEAYHLHNLSLERSLTLSELNFKVRFEVNNLLNTEYQSILSRPMPPRNYAICLEVNFNR